MRILCVLLAIQFSLTVVVGQDRETIKLNEFLNAEKLPPGYVATTKDLKSDGLVIGKVITVSHPDEIPRVTIQCEFKELPDVNAKREYVKSNFKAYAAGLVKLGYKTVDKNVPNFDEQMFERPLSMTVHFFNDERKLWTYHEFHFTDKAIWIKATANKPEALEEIKNWATTIKPKSPLD